MREIANVDEFQGYLKGTLRKEKLFSLLYSTKHCVWLPSHYRGDYYSVGSSLELGCNL